MISDIGICPNTTYDIASQQHKFNNTQAKMPSSIYPFMPNRISYSNQLEQSISVLRDVVWYFFLMFTHILIEHSASKQWSPDQTPPFAASDLCLHYLPLSHKRTLGLYGLRAHQMKQHCKQFLKETVYYRHNNTPVTLLKLS